MLHQCHILVFAHSFPQSHRFRVASTTFFRIQTCVGGNAQGIVEVVFALQVSRTTTGSHLQKDV
jgi:hypothetical protein